MIKFREFSIDAVLLCKAEPIFIFHQLSQLSLLWTFSLPDPGSGPESGTALTQTLQPPLLWTTSAASLIFMTLPLLHSSPSQLLLRTALHLSLSAVFS